MNLSFVEAFYWVATLKNVKAAARQLGREQSTISKRIRVIEEELHVTLLDRRDKRVRLTPAGVRFFADAGRLLDLWHEIETGFGAVKERAVSLRIGVIESVLHSWLIPWIEQLRAQQPELELQLTVETTPVLHELMQRGAVDFVLASLPVGADGVRTRALPPMAMTLVGSRALHKRRRYTLEQLARYDLLTFQRGSQPHLSLLDTLRRAKVKAARVHAISSISAMVRLVAGGFGVATLPHATITDVSTGEGLRALRCDTELAALPIHASWRTDPTSRAIDAVVESAVDHAKRQGDEPGRHRFRS
jgi:DNA-binding transcriptional LysR family regulator